LPALRPALRHPDRSLRLRQAASAGEQNSRTVTDAAHASIRRFPAFALSKSEIALSKREVWGVRCVGMPSMPDVPSLRYVRGQPSFDAGTNVVPALLGRNPDELENSEDCRSAGGHGNQHVRLRGTSIDASTVCPAPATVCCRGPGKLSDPKKSSLLQRKVSTAAATVRARRRYLPMGTGITSSRPPGGDRVRTPLCLIPHSKRSHGSPLVPASC
jgi:hypothetical protein